MAQRIAAGGKVGPEGINGGDDEVDAVGSVGRRTVGRGMSVREGRLVERRVSSTPSLHGRIMRWLGRVPSKVVIGDEEEQVEGPSARKASGNKSKEANSNGVGATKENCVAAWVDTVSQHHGRYSPVGDGPGIGSSMTGDHPARLGSPSAQLGSPSAQLGSPSARSVRDTSHAIVAPNALASAPQQHVTTPNRE